MEKVIMYTFQYITWVLAAVCLVAGIIGRIRAAGHSDT